MWRSAGDQENAAVNKIQEILVQIHECNKHKRETSSLYKKLEDVLVEYASIRYKKKKEKA